MADDSDLKIKLIMGDDIDKEGKIKKEEISDTKPKTNDGMTDKAKIKMEDIVDTQLKPGEKPDITIKVTTEEVFVPVVETPKTETTDVKKKLITREIPVVPVKQRKQTKEKNNNNDFKWRSWSKNVAYVDLTLISMGLPAGIICVIVGVNTGVPIHPDMNRLPEDQKEGIKKTIVFCAITLLVGVSALGIWAAIKLMSATELGRRPLDALKMARFWKNVNLLFVALTLTGMFVTETFLTSGVNLLWHVILLYIVSQYIDELEITATPNTEKVKDGGKGDKEAVDWLISNSTEKV